MSSLGIPPVAMSLDAQEQCRGSMGLDSGFAYTNSELPIKTRPFLVDMYRQGQYHRNKMLSHATYHSEYCWYGNTFIVSKSAVCIHCMAQSRTFRIESDRSRYREDYVLWQNQEGKGIKQKVSHQLSRVQFDLFKGSFTVDFDSTICSNLFLPWFVVSWCH